MAADPLDALLAKLCSGDVVAAEQVFRAYEPYLRKVVRRQLPPRLRAKFDSVDVVQSVWADLLDGFRGTGWRFADVAQLRTFLYKVTRHRFIDRVRQHRTALSREQPLEATDPEQLPPSPQPAVSDVMQADDLWEQMLALCPPAYHELLRYKRDGLPMAEIVARTGLHEGSVRRILRNLARQMACRQQTAASGGRQPTVASGEQA
jgi:RNA polymerase sigma-70 factor (ECF subfamily)